MHHASLRILYVSIAQSDMHSECCGVGDAGLTAAVHLIELDASYGSSEQPAETSSGVLAASMTRGLASAYEIAELDASKNPHITAVAPFAAFVGSRCERCVRR